jgi:signal transduction histidine kinase
VGRALFRDPFADPDCWSDCAVNVLLVHGDAGLARFLTRADLVFAVGVAVALPLLAAGRWRAATPAARRALWPLLAAGSSFAVAQGLWAARLLSSAPEDPHRAAFTALFAARSAALLALGAALVWTVALARRSRVAVARLIDDLRDAPASHALQEVLARAVGDPDLVVAYPVGDRHVDADGRPVAVPAPGGPIAVTSIERNGAPVALVLHDPAALGEGDLAGEIGAAARVAVDNERLQAQSQAQIGELRASRARVVETADAARRRLERDLHDGAQQRLVSLALMLQLATDSVDQQIAAQLPAAEAELRAATVELRELAHGIHPAALSEEGLAPAVRALADRVPLAIDALELPSSRPSPAVETAAYYLVDEVARSSESARLALRTDTAALAIELVADGVPAGALSHIRDRIAALDGELVVEEGRVSARIPCR